MKESSDGETLMAVGIWFQIWGAAEEKARRPKSVFALGCLANLVQVTRSLVCGLFAADMVIPVGCMVINEVEKLNRLTFGTVGGSNDQSLPVIADLHLDSDDESQDTGKLHSISTIHE